MRSLRSLTTTTTKETSTASVATTDESYEVTKPGLEDRQKSREDSYESVPPSTLVNYYPKPTSAERKRSDMSWEPPSASVRLPPSKMSGEREWGVWKSDENPNMPPGMRKKIGFRPKNVKGKHKWSKSGGRGRVKFHSKGSWHSGPIQSIPIPLKKS